MGLLWRPTGGPPSPALPTYELLGSIRDDVQNGYLGTVLKAALYVVERWCWRLPPLLREGHSRWTYCRWPLSCLSRIIRILCPKCVHIWVLNGHLNCPEVLSPTIQFFLLLSGSSMVAVGTFSLLSSFRETPFLLLLGGIFLLQLCRVLITPSLCSTGWWESNRSHWSVCGFFFFFDKNLDERRNISKIAKPVQLPQLLHWDDLDNWEPLQTYLYLIHIMWCMFSHFFNGMCFFVQMLTKLHTWWA